MKNNEKDILSGVRCFKPPGNLSKPFRKFYLYAGHYFPDVLLCAGRVGNKVAPGFSKHRQLKIWASPWLVFRIHGSNSVDTHRHLAVSARHKCTQFMVCGLESGTETCPSKLFQTVQECDLLLCVCAFSLPAASKHALLGFISFFEMY